MATVIVNYWAVIASVVASMVIGFVWYGPLFGKAWMKEVGTTEADMKKGDGMGMMYGLTALGSLVEAYVLAHFVSYAGATTLALGAVTGFWIWLGFILPVFLGLVLFEGRSMKLFGINVSYHLVNVMIMGMILASWR